MKFNLKTTMEDQYAGKLNSQVLFFFFFSSSNMNRLDNSLLLLTLCSQS